MTTESTILTECFPVQIEKLSQLFAYELSIGESNVHTIGGKLSYRLRKIFEAGRWVWSNYNIISDTLKSQDELNQALERLWSEEPETRGKYPVLAVIWLSRKFGEKILSLPTEITVSRVRTAHQSSGGSVRNAHPNSGI